MAGHSQFRRLFRMRRKAVGTAAFTGGTQAIIERLKSGALVGSQRNIARQLGLPVTTLRNVVETDPRVRLVASREGRPT